MAIMANQCKARMDKQWSGPLCGRSGHPAERDSERESCSISNAAVACHGATPPKQSNSRRRHHKFVNTP